jgi:hypothetical protein
MQTDLVDHFLGTGQIMTKLFIYEYILLEMLRYCPRARRAKLQYCLESAPSML